MDQTSELCHRLIIDCGNRTHFFTFFVILARTDLIDADGADLVGGSARMIDDRNQETGSKCFINTERFACLNTVAQRSQVIVCIREAEFLYAQIFRNGKEVIDKDLILAGLVNVKCQQTFTRINKTTRQIIDRIRIGNNHLLESLCFHFLQNFLKSLCVHHDVLLISKVAVTGRCQTVYDINYLPLL